MKAFLKGTYAGILIGLGGCIFLSVDDKVLGAFLFSIGLITILVMKLDLFTGKVCYLENYHFFSLFGCLFSNYLGTAIMGVITYIGNPALIDKVSSMALAKIDKPLVELFIDSIVCGICIAVAVKGYRKAEGVGKYLSVVLGVMVFILAGAEHVVANMYYLFIPFYYARLYSVWTMLRFLLLNAVGNAFGGLLMAGVDVVDTLSNDNTRGGLNNNEKRIRKFDIRN